MTKDSIIFLILKREPDISIALERKLIPNILLKNLKIMEQLYFDILEMTLSLALQRRCEL